MSKSGEKPTVLLEGWQLVELHRRPFYLVGYATDHPKLPGFRRRIRTSLVLSLDESRGFAETVNTRYELRHPVRDMTFHEDGTVATIVLDGFTADRVIGSDEWLVLRGHDVVASIPSPNPVNAMFQLLALAFPEQ
jgi:hypothetical protein